MTAKRMHRQPLSKPLAELACVSKHDLEDFTEIGRVHRIAAIEYIGKVAEQPGPAETTSSDNHSIAPGLAHHAQGVFGFPDIAVPEHRNMQRLLEFRDRIPFRMTMVKLRGRARVQPDGGASFILGNSKVSAYSVCRKPCAAPSSSSSFAYQRRCTTTFFVSFHTNANTTHNIPTNQINYFSFI